MHHAVESGTGGWTGRALQQLDALAHLEPGWDAYGAERPSPKAIGDARRLVQDIANQLSGADDERAFPSNVGPIADGRVHLEWSAGTTELAVDVSPLGYLGYLFVNHRQTEPTFSEADDVPWDTIVALAASTVSSSNAAK